jgi:hypothetical protein
MLSWLQKFLMYFKAYLQTQCLFAWQHGKIKRNQPRTGSFLGAISKCLKVPHSSLQTIVPKYKHHGTTQPSYLSGRGHVLSPRDECTLVRKVQINPRTTAKDPVKMLEETGTKVSISTVKWVLYRYNLKDCSARKKPLLHNHHKKARLRFANAHGDKDRTFWRNVLWSDEKKIELFGHNDHRYVWRKKGEACKPKNTISTVKCWLFAALAPQWWNKLPHDARTAESITTFRRHLKPHLFKEHLG